MLDACYIMLFIIKTIYGHKTYNWQYNKQFNTHT